MASHYEGQCPRCFDDEGTNYGCVTCAKFRTSEARRKLFTAIETHGAGFTKEAQADQFLTYVWDIPEVEAALRGYRGQQDFYNRLAKDAEEKK